MSAVRNVQPGEVDILARLLGNGHKALPTTIARYIIDLGFSHDERVRMHDLAARNQESLLSSAQRDELIAYSKAGTVLSVLKSKARRALEPKPKKRATS